MTMQKINEFTDTLSDLKINIVNEISYELLVSEQSLPLRLNNPVSLINSPDYCIAAISQTIDSETGQYELTAYLNSVWIRTEDIFQTPIDNTLNVEILLKLLIAVKQAIRVNS